MGHPTMSISAALDHPAFDQGSSLLLLGSWYIRKTGESTNAKSDHQTRSKLKVIWHHCTGQQKAQHKTLANCKFGHVKITGRTLTHLTMLPHLRNVRRNIVRRCRRACRVPKVGVACRSSPAYCGVTPWAHMLSRCRAGVTDPNCWRDCQQCLSQQQVRQRCLLDLLLIVCHVVGEVVVGM